MSGSSELEASRHAEAACQHIHGLNRATLWERDQIPTETAEQLAQLAAQQQPLFPKPSPNSQRCSSRH